MPIGDTLAVYICIRLSALEADAIFSPRVRSEIYSRELNLASGASDDCYIVFGTIKSIDILRN